MPLFPAVKFMDIVIGVDVHAVAPVPGIPIHPYVGPVYLWSTPVFPSINVFVNGMPACSVGALGYFFHVPQGIPVPPTPTNTSYWKRYLVNIPMVLTLTGLTILANVAIAGIASLIPKPKSAESFIKDVTGIDTSSRATTWQTIKGSFAAYSQWQTWVKLLMPPLPYPGAQGSVAVGSPNVTVNGGALAFVGPLLATSCSDIPVVPNACTLGFSNVLVGVTFADMLRGIAVASAQRGIQAALQHGMDAATHEDEEEPPPPEEPAEEQNNECDDAGHPVSQATGAAWSRFTDVDAFHFRLRREVRSTWCDEDGPFGFGMRHDAQFTLLIRPGMAVLTDPDNRRVFLPAFEDGSFGSVVQGWTLRQPAENTLVLHHRDRGSLVFRHDDLRADAAMLLSRTRGDHYETFSYDVEGRLARIVVRPSGPAAPACLAYITFVHDNAGHIKKIRGRSEGGSAVTLGTYFYDEGGRLVSFTDALGGTWGYEYDAANRCTRETNPNGYSFRYNFDEIGRCVHTAGDDGLWRVDLRYAPGRTLMTECDNGIWAYEHDAHHTITEVVDPYGGRKVRRVASDGRVTSEVDSGGRAMTNLYDMAGALIGRLDRWGNRWPTPAEMPKLPNPLARRLPETAFAREWGDLMGPDQAVTRLLPTALEQALAAAIPQRARVTPSEQRDLLGRVVERVDACGAVRRYCYDPASNCVATVDAEGMTESQVFASWNLCVERRNAAGEATGFRFTKREKIAAIVDPGGAVSKYVYDCKDRLTHVIRHARLRESYRYDEGDRLVEKLDADSVTLLTVGIGANGLMKTRTLASGQLHYFAYDSVGNITEASTANARVLMRYAGKRRLSDTRDGLGVLHSWEDGRLAATTYFGRFTVTYETLGPGDVVIRPPAGQPHRVTSQADGSVLRQLGNSTCELSRYDAAGRCIGRACWWRGEQAPAEWVAYDYSAEGELRTVRDSRGDATAYRYDAARRVTGRSGAQGSCAFAYDAAGNLTSTPARPELRCAEGNRLESGDGVRFSYDGRDRLATVAHEDGRVVRFIYDSLDDLIRVEGALGCNIWEAEKDGLGRRMAKAVDGARTDYYWDGDRLAAEIAADGRVRLYVYSGSDALLPVGFIDYTGLNAAPEEGAAFCVFHDQIGLPTLIEDAVGRAAWRALSTDPYGEVTVAPGAQLAYHLRFPGHLYDVETGLHDNRFRSYDPALARYLQPDPTGQSGGVNLYAYSGNPLAQVDLFGLSHVNKANAATDEKPGGTKPEQETPNEPPENLAPAGATRDEALAAVKAAKNVPADQEPDILPNNGPNNDKSAIKGSENLYFVDNDGNDVTIRHDYDGHTFPDDHSQDRGPHFNDADGGHYDYGPPGQQGEPFGPIRR